MQSKAEQTKAKHSLSTGASREAPVDNDCFALLGLFSALHWQFIKSVYSLLPQPCLLPLMCNLMCICSGTDISLVQAGMS